MNATQFTDQLRKAFPELRRDIEEGPDLIHVQARALARMTQAAIGRQNASAFTRCTGFMERAFRDGDKDVRDAVYVSYLEELRFDEASGAAAFACLPAGLLQGWHEVMDHLRELDRKAAEGRSTP